MQTSENVTGSREAADCGIIVLGMHRGGTSLLADVIHRWGAYTDEDALAPADMWNQHGYHEHRPLIAFNDELLKAVDSSWDAPPGEVEQSRLAAMAHEAPYAGHARKLIQEMKAGGTPWFWKDPRLTVLLPFWKRVWENVIFVVPVRAPAEIAASLRARDGFPVSHSLLLWQCYMSAILADRELASTASFVSYERLLKNAVNECTQLCRFLDHRSGTNPEESDSRPEFMAQAVAPELRRNRSIVPFSHHSSATTAQRELDRLLQLHADGYPVAPTEAFGPEPGWRDRLCAEASKPKRRNSPNRFQVFWRNPASEFVETQSRSVPLDDNSQRQSVRIDLPPLHDEGPMSLRMDVSEKAGCMRLHQLAVLDMSANSQWTWDGRPESIEELSKNEISVCAMEGSGLGCVLNLEGTDPWFELPLTPEQSVALENGGTVTFECTYLSPSALIAQAAHSAAEVEALRSEHQLMAEELRVMKEGVAALRAEQQRLSAQLSAMSAKGSRLGGIFGRKHGPA